MSNLYYVKYEAEYEAYIDAESEEKALEKMNELTDYGTKNMNDMRYNGACGS